MHNLIITYLVLILCFQDDLTVRVWDISTGKSFKTLKDHADRVTAVS